MTEKINMNKEDKKFFTLNIQYLKDNLEAEKKDLTDYFIDTKEVADTEDALSQSLIEVQEKKRLIVLSKLNDLIAEYKKHIEMLTLDLDFVQNKEEYAQTFRNDLWERYIAKSNARPRIHIADEAQGSRRAAPFYKKIINIFD